MSPEAWVTLAVAAAAWCAGAGAGWRELRLLRADVDRLGGRLDALVAAVLRAPHPPAHSAASATAAKGDVWGSSGRS